MKFWSHKVSQVNKVNLIIVQCYSFKVVFLIKSYLDHSIVKSSSEEKAWAAIRKVAIREEFCFSGFITK